MSGASAIPSVADLRKSCRTAKSAVLATIAVDHKQVGDGWPVTSMVVPTFDIDGAPILLISDLADHTRHIKADNRVSLLITPQQDTQNQADTIQTDNPRITIFGRAIRDDAPETRAGYLRAHPDAAQYAGFADFGFYRIEVAGVYWVGGFGKQRRLSGTQFIASDCAQLKSSHDDIVTHMNNDHADALAGIVSHFTSHDPDTGWQMHSIDCDGMVLRSETADSRKIRIDFQKTIHTPGDARGILVEMCKKWRA